MSLHRQRLAQEAMSLLRHHRIYILNVQSVERKLPLLPLSFVTNVVQSWLAPSPQLPWDNDLVINSKMS